MAVAAETRISRWGAVVFALTTVTGFAASAHADEADAEAEAEEAFTEGRELMEDGSYAEACEAFARSQRLDPAPGTLLNLGLCHKRLGKLATSHAKFRAAADLAAREEDETRERVAKERAEALEPRLSTLKIDLDVEAPDGLEVTVDGEDITSKLGAAQPLDPGRYELEAAAPGHESWKRSVTLSEEGVTKLVTIPELEESQERAEIGTEASEAEREPLRDGAGAATPRPETKSPDGAASKPGRALRIGGMTAIGAGAAAAATGLGFGLHARSTWQRSRDYCDEDNVCSHRGLDLASRAERSADLSTVLVGAGIAAASTGAILWLMAPGSQPASPSPSARLVPIASGESMGVSIRGQF